MDPLQEFEKICGWQFWVLTQAGIGAYKANFKPSVHTAVLLSQMILFVLVTAYDAYHFSKDLFKLAFAFATLSYSVIGFNRVGYFLTDPEHFNEMWQDARETYLQVGSDPREKWILASYTKLLKQCVLFYSVTMFVCCAVTVLFPAILYLWTGQKALPIGVELPFVDPDSTKGYLLNYSYHVCCILWAPPVFAAMENMCIALVLNVCIQYEILLIGLDDLNQLISNNVDGKLNSKIRQQLKQVLQYHQRLTILSNRTEQRLSSQNFTEISSSAFQIVLTLFVLSKTAWIPGYIIMFISTFQTLVLCLLGTLIELKSDQLTANIYNIDWHEMPLPDQKSVLILLAKSQRPSLLTYGGLLPINMNLFLMVYKHIYSYFMVLLKM